MRKKQKVLWKLFLSTLYLSAFTFGGGYVIVTLMKDKFVDKYHWIEENEMLDLIAIAQSAPGAIAVNGAIVVGYKLGRSCRGTDSNFRNSSATFSYHLCDLCFLSDVLR